MNNSTLSILFLVSIATPQCILYAGDTVTSHYSYTQHDKDIFTNHATKKNDLIYPTSLIDSIPMDTITIDPFTLERLIHPALTTIIYQQDLLVVRHPLLFGPDSYNPETKEFYKRENDRMAYLDSIHTKIKSLELLTPDVVDVVEQYKSPSIKIPERDFMLLVQYAARRIVHKYSHSEVVIKSDAGLRNSLHGDAHRLLSRYREYEQK
jgi:hypothetical protein